MTTPSSFPTSSGDESQRAWPWLDENGGLPRPGTPGGSPIRVLDAPTAGITRPDQEIPVIVHLTWLDGWEADVPAAAEAWTRDAVQVRWVDGETVRRDWVPARTVRRTVDDQRHGDDRRHGDD